MYTDVVKVFPTNTPISQPKIRAQIHELITRDERIYDYTNGRLLQEIQREIKKCSQLVGETNDQQTRTLLKSQLQCYMEGLLHRRAIADYRVVCDGTNNTPFDISNHQMNIEVIIKPRRIAEYVCIKGTIRKS
jgi:phage tail sheath protein FI